MSKYRVKADVSYVNLADLNALLNYIESVKTDCASGLDNGETIVRCAKYHFCQHDNAVPTRCKDYECIDFDGVEITH